jgi:hypothetical protein
MPHPIIDQYRFTRAEWLRGLAGVNAEDATFHIGPMNCISWTVGHLAWHEQSYWLERAQDIILFPILNQLFAYGAPMSTPVLNEMLTIWQTIIPATDEFLDSLTTETLQGSLLRKGKPTRQSIGSALQRITYHYWYHIGEIQAVRQMLGHTGLPEYVGDIENQSPYHPE